MTVIQQDPDEREFLQMKFLLTVALLMITRPKCYRDDVMPQ